MRRMDDARHNNITDGIHIKQKEYGTFRIHLRPYWTSPDHDVAAQARPV